MREGTLDLLGWSEPGCVFTAIDAKIGHDRLTAAQRGFMELVLACGGRAGEARSLEDARAIIEGRKIP
jgi:hypothetical protein